MMPRSPVVQRLSQRTRTGLREMPSNAAWLLSRVVKPTEAVGTAAESAAAGARDKRRRVSAAVVDAAPIGGDSVDIRMKRARDAAERARDAEEQAMEAAQEYKDRSDHARQVSDHGRARLAEVERETSRRVKQQVAEAQKAADESVERARQAAEADAEEQRRKVQEEADNEIEEAERDAEESQQRAEELVEDATEKLADARRLASEAVAAARAAAEEANRQAQQLEGEVEQQASDAEARVKASEEMRDHLVATAKNTARELRDTSNGGLKSYSKPELVELAASIGIKGRTNMTKDELVDAITRASRKR
jgi:colicin import membrane protein